LNIHISKAALTWFKEEVGLDTGSYVRFYPMIYGNSPVQENFSLGFSIEAPVDAIASSEAEGIHFYVEETDVWYFNGHDLYVEFNEAMDEVEYQYKLPKIKG
jgi:uncharacterized protein YneR